MATVPPSSLQLPNPFPLLSSSPKSTPRPNPSSSPSPPEPPTQTFPPPTNPRGPESNDAFEDRLIQVRLRYGSGTGKKAELQKTRKKCGSSSSSLSSGSVFLPQVPLKEPVSEGLKVDFGFSPYRERVNGWLAILGPSALLSVELAEFQSYFILKLKLIYTPKC